MTDIEEFTATYEAFLDFVHPDDRAAVDSAYTRSVQEGNNGYEIEHRVVQRDSDDVRYVHERCEHERDTAGAIIRSIGMVQDITERKQAEDALRTTIYELQKSQEVAKVGSWVWHIPQNRVEWSDEMYRIFGIDKEMFAGDLTQIISDCIHPYDRAEVNRSNTSVMEQNAPIPVEYRILRPDRSVRTVWAEAGELELDGAGRPMLLRGIVHDITERKRFEIVQNAQSGR